MAEAAILEEVKTDLSKRVDNLKERIFSERPKICTERAFFVTESYRDNEHRPTVIKRAPGLAHVLENMSIFILEDEIIVGNQISSPRGVPVFPEMACNWIEEELSSFGERPERFVISKADAIIPYWKGRSVQDQIYGVLPPELNSALDAGVLNLGLHLGKGIGHFLLDYDLILRRGCEGLIANVQERRSALDTARNPGDLDKYHFLSAVEMVYKSVIKFAERFSNLAREMADAEKDLNRKQELMEIGRICEKVPRKPAESFREALQIFWFTQLIPHIDSDGTAISPGRFDLYMWPYLNHDLEQGRLSYSEGQDLVDQLWLKFNQILSLWKAEDVKYFGGFPISQNPSRLRTALRPVMAPTARGRPPYCYRPPNSTRSWLPTAPSSIKNFCPRCSWAKGIGLSLPNTCEPLWVFRSWKFSLMSSIARLCLTRKHVLTATQMW